MIQDEDIKHGGDSSVSNIDIAYFSRRSATGFRFIANQPFDENTFSINLDEMPFKEGFENDA